MTSLGQMPGATNCPTRTAMPDVLKLNDGTKVSTVEEWQKRREEIKRTLEYYAVGQSPPPPSNVKGRETHSQTVANGSVKYRLVHLTFGPKEELGMDIGIFTPAERGPFPTVILQGGTPPEAVPLPRLPPGPNQGRGQDVLLVVGSAEADASAPPAVPAATEPSNRPPALRLECARQNGQSGERAEDIAKTNAGLFRRGTRRDF